MAIIKDNILNEQQQVKKALKDKEAFAPLYEKYFGDIFKYIFRRVNDEVITADITSQVFLKSLLHLHKWKYEGLPFSAWLYRIALNECREYFRITKRVQYVVLDAGAREELSIDMAEAETLEEKFLITEQLLYNLSKNDLHLIELRYYENLSFKEIGYLLEITEINAKVKLHRIMKKLKKFMDHGTKI